MNWKKIGNKLSAVHFQTQRALAAALALFAGLFTLFSLIPVEGDDSNSLLWAARSLGYLLIACAATWVYYHIMKKRYPDYPYHRKDPPDPFY